MGIKDFFYTEKGKITSSVLVAILITSAILVPVSIFTTKSMNNGGEGNPIKSAGYDSSVTSTGEEVDTWMQLDGWDSESANLEMQKTLLNNENYFDVKNPEEMFDKVKNNNAVAYLSNVDVNIQKDEFYALNLSEDGTTYISPDDAVNYFIKKPLNIYMKVPNIVATDLKNNNINDGTGIWSEATPAEDSIFTTIDSKGYRDWLIENDYLTEFFWSFIIFNWMAFSEESQTALNEYGYSVNSVNSISSEDFDILLENAITNYTSLVGNPTPESGNITITIDGTGTANAAVQKSIDTFNIHYKDNSNVPIVTQLLNDGGSWRAWETPEKSVTNEIPGLSFNPDSYDGQNDGNANAFISTQSRSFRADGEVTDEDTDASDDGLSVWGYDEDSAMEFLESNTSEEGIYTGTQSDDVPISYTLAIDNIVFFVSEDTSFEFNNETYKPTGITREALYMIYNSGGSYPITWEELYAYNLIEAEKI